MKYKLRRQYSTNPDTALIDILTSRGVTNIQNFLHPSKECELDPYKLENINQAVDMLLKHLRANHQILFIVDADCDGFTSSAILWLYIKNIFPDAKLNFTVHEHKQHGLSDKIDWLENINDHYELILVPDAGSYDIEYHQRLMEMGCDVLCLDHHEQQYDEQGQPICTNLPNTIIVNNQLSPEYSNKSLCGAGVVYKFCEVLDDILGIQQAQNYLDLVALGEIADVMDRTTSETNYLMLTGLKQIKNKGFQTLLEAQSFSLKEKAVYPYPNLTPIDVAFYIAPLINAITRVGTQTEKETMFYCFIEPEKIVQSTKRGAKIGDTETAASQTARVGAILIEVDDEDNIPQELTGLVAMAVVSKYHKPCMIGRRNDSNIIQGSIRSDSNFNGLPSFKAFLEQSNLIDYAAGHDNACGFGINGNRIEQLLQYANKNLKASDFENCYLVDYILDATDKNAPLLTALAEHPEYFGNHIDEIKFVITNISMANILVMGAGKDSLKISYNGIDYVRFKDTNFVEEVMNNRTKKLTVYGRANLNTFAGKTSVQIFCDDYQFEEDSSKYDF